MKAEEATVDALLTNTMLMRDMLVAGGATTGGMSNDKPGVAHAYFGAPSRPLLGQGGRSTGGAPQGGHRSFL